MADPLSSQLGSGGLGLFGLGSSGGSSPSPPSTTGPGVVVAGVDRSGYLDKAESGKGGQSSFTLQTGSRGQASVSFRIKPTDPWAGPVVGNPISLYNQTGHREFGGLITAILQQWEGDSAHLVLVCTCASFERFLDKHLIPPQSYFDQTADVIFTALFNSCGVGETITLGTIQVGPNVPNAIYDGGDVLTAAFDKLATDSGFVWGVDPDTETLYFKAPNITPAPFSLTGPTGSAGPVLFDSIQWDTTQQDFRDRQRIRINLQAFSPDVWLFGGDGVTTNFTLPVPVTAVLSVAIVGSTRGTVNASTTGNLSPGDTVTVDGTVYTFVSTLDNTVPFQVLIGATAQDTMANFSLAFGGAPGPGAGVNFSWPTYTHRSCVAGVVTAGAFELFTKQVGTHAQSSSRRHLEPPPGVVIHSIAVSKSAANFAWSAATLTGATDGADTTGTIGLMGTDAGKDYYWNPGSPSIIAATAPPSGATLAVTYYRLGGDVITVENTPLVLARQAIEGGTGLYEAIMDASTATNPVAFDIEAATAQANALLSSYGVLPETLTFMTDQPGLALGQVLTVALPSPFASSLNGTWAVQKIQGTYIPGMPGWRYTIDAIASRSSPPAALARKSTTIQFWEKLAELGAARNPTASLGQGSGGAPSSTNPSFEFSFGLGPQPVAVFTNDQTNLPAITQPASVSSWRITAVAAPAGSSATFGIYKNAVLFATVTLTVGNTDATGTFTATAIAPGDHVYAKCTAGNSVVGVSIAVE